MKLSIFALCIFLFTFNSCIKEYISKYDYYSLVETPKSDTAYIVVNSFIDTNRCDGLHRTQINWIKNQFIGNVLLITRNSYENLFFVYGPNETISKSLPEDDGKNMGVHEGDFFVYVPEGKEIPIQVIKIKYH